TSVPSCPSLALRLGRAFFPDALKSRGDSQARRSRSLIMVRFGLGLAGLLSLALPVVVAQEAPRMTPKRSDVKPFQYKDAKIPFYAPNLGAKSGPLTQMQLPLEPAESMKHFVHPVDFELKLFVSEPQIKR